MPPRVNDRTIPQEKPKPAAATWRQRIGANTFRFIHPDDYNGIKNILAGWNNKEKNTKVKIEQKLTSAERNIQREVSEALNGAINLPAFLHAQEPKQENLIKDGYHFYQKVDKSYKVLIKSGELKQTFDLHNLTPGLQELSSQKPNSNEPISNLPPALSNYLKNGVPYYHYEQGKQPDFKQANCGYHFYIDENEDDSPWKVFVKKNDNSDDSSQVIVLRTESKASDAESFLNKLETNINEGIFSPIPQIILESIKEHGIEIPRPTPEGTGLSNTIKKLKQRPSLNKLDNVEFRIKVYILDEMLKPFSNTPEEKLPLHTQGLKQQLEDELQLLKYQGKLAENSVLETQINTRNQVEAAIEHASTDKERKLIGDLFKEAQPQARKYGNALRAEQKIKAHRTEFEEIDNHTLLTNSTPSIREKAIKSGINYETTTRVIDTAKIADSPDESLFKLYKSALHTPQKEENDNNLNSIATDTPQLIQLETLQGVNGVEDINDKLLTVNELINEIKIATEYLLDCNADYLVKDYQAKQIELRKAIQQAYLAINDIKATHGYLSMQGNNFAKLQNQLEHLTSNFTPELENHIWNHQNGFFFKQQPLTPDQTLAFRQKQNGESVITGGSYNPGTGQYERRVVKNIKGCTPKLFHEAVLLFDKEAKKHPHVYGFHDPLGHLFIYGFSAFETDKNGMITRVKFKNKDSQEHFFEILEGLCKKQDLSNAEFGAKPKPKQDSATGGDTNQQKNAPVITEESEANKENQGLNANNLWANNPENSFESSFSIRQTEENRENNEHHYSP